MADQHDVLIGTILGDYRLTRRLGSGTFGTVYLAEQRTQQALFAVKVLRMQAVQAEDLRGFLNEARVMRLRHPHIMSVLDFGLSREQVPYLVMEYAAGGTLRSRHPQSTRLALATVLTYTEQLASALQYAHDLRLIHRDLKPENVLLRTDGVLLLSDFGIAKVIEQTSLASSTSSAGTPAYMAPEQSQGKPVAASDQYALAVMVYEWICGQRPFQGAPLEIMLQHRVDPPPPLTSLASTLPLPIEQIVLQALAKEPTARFPRVQDFAAALRAAITNTAPTLRSDPVPQSTSPLTTQAPEATVLKVQPTPSTLPPTLLPTTLPVPSLVPEEVSSGAIAHPITLPPSVPLPLFPLPRTESPLSVLLRRWPFALLVMLLLIGASLGTVLTLNYNRHAIATTKAGTTATAASNAYNAAVTANGMMFGFDAAHTHSNPYEQVLSPANVSGLRQTWTYPRVGRINTSPVVASSVLYFGADRSLYALDSGSHTIRWNFQTGGGVSSPAVANGVVYVGSTDKLLYALDARTGTKLWSFATGDIIYSSPAVANGVVYIGSLDKSLYALDARSGTKLWSFATRHSIYFSSPAVANEVVYVGSLDESLYALDARSGIKLWSFATGGEITSSPTVANGVVYIGSNDGRLYDFQ